LIGSNEIGAISDIEIKSMKNVTLNGEFQKNEEENV